MRISPELPLLWSTRLINRRNSNQNFRGATKVFRLRNRFPGLCPFQSSPPSPALPSVAPLKKHPRKKPSPNTRRKTVRRRKPTPRTLKKSRRARNTAGGFVVGHGSNLPRDCKAISELKCSLPGVLFPMYTQQVLHPATVYGLFRNYDVRLTLKEIAASLKHPVEEVARLDRKSTRLNSSHANM